MPLSNPKLFGLNVLSLFADVENKTKALTAIDLPPLDLDVIRGSSAAGATLGDWISLSRLRQPLYRTLDRYYNDSTKYTNVLTTRASILGSLFGNLTINGSLSGSAIRFRYIDGTGAGATVKIADISTSRVSAWSSVGTGATVPISYGARVSIISGGSLQFGTESTAGQKRLQTTIVPQPKEFASEFPTNRITCTIGGQSVVLYAMKGIPLIFTGFFRNLDANVTFTSLLNNTAASWKIVEVANPNSFSNFANVGSTSSTINFRSTSSRERYIQLYYSPDYISTITINSAGITAFPVTKLSNLVTLNFSYNNIRNLPDFTSFSPNLQYLYLVQNPLYLSETESERKLNATVINKLPTTLKDLTIGGTFYGSIPINLIANRFPNLITLNLNRGGGAYFHPDVDDPNGYIPNVTNTCETYYIYGNDFRTIGSSSGSFLNVKELTNLISLELSGNYYLSDANFSISASNNKIQYVNIHSTGLPCPDLNGKSSLTTFYGYYCRNIGSIFNNSGTYKFNNCTSLSTLYFYASPLTGAMPKFTNPSLSYLELRYTSLTGGDPSGDTTYVIPEKTFEVCKNLQYMLLQSGNLLTSPIHPNAFTYTPNLYYLWYISYGRTTGSLPSLLTCPSLTYLVLHYNNFTGTIPSFSSNPNIYYVDLTYNAFTGAVPAYKNLSNLVYLYLYNNKFSSLNKFINLPNLTYFYANNNLLTGAIPSFSDCPNLYYLILYNNQLTNYTSGGLTTNYRLRYLDLSSNQLSQQAVNSIINDLFSNYNSVNRSGVTVNLRGNSLPSGETLDKVLFLRSKGWTITYE